ncbi:vWA domain-containing protein [Dongia rigui]|uniref:VWA domain-containing protein n=1 Tax=Dongia rigui TaxID=940149 RepID=A0ABU5E207_9PROT|nr:VWA domain-containing protein [Dongia rigui]MDY0873595.1 VWA domain-containing protein [Dongia rigui]
MSAAAIPDLGVALRRRVAGFARTLRDNGYKIGLAESADALRVIAAEGVDRPAAARSALKALLCGRRSDWEGFDALFDAYWLGRRVKTRVATSNQAALATQSTQRLLGPATASSGGQDLATDVARGPGNDADNAAPQGRREGASRFETLARTDFRKIADPDELAKAHALAERLSRRMRANLTRRTRNARKGTRIDLRRTIHASLGSGGTPLDLVHRLPKKRPLRLVLLVDASGSMSLYTGIFLRFVHGLLDHFREAEAFLFHTRLVHVSDALREKDTMRALDRLGLMAEGVGGGTRAGDALATFNRWHAARVLHSRTCVVIFSDGYDTSPPELLGAEMQRLRRRCRRIVWLNPLIGWEGYAPTARGMAAALPYIDLFAPAHNLASLAALEPYLIRL